MKDLTCLGMEFRLCLVKRKGVRGMFGTEEWHGQINGLEGSLWQVGGWTGHAGLRLEGKLGGDHRCPGERWWWTGPVKGQWGWGEASRFERLVIRGIQGDSWFLAERYVAIWLFFEFAKARGRYSWFHSFHYEHLSRTFYVLGLVLNAAVWCYQVVPFVPHSPSSLLATLWPPRAAPCLLH